ncbi:MAG: hypothetical protein L0G99_08180, partial [Propionibacteriales bacterium]|nr:hypothetical protein [Propionibacteriales bacterium]
MTMSETRGSEGPDPTVDPSATPIDEAHHQADHAPTPTVRRPAVSDRSPDAPEPDSEPVRMAKVSRLG